MTIGDYFKIFVLVLVLVLVCAVLWLWKDKDNAQASLLAAQTQHKADVVTHNEDQATIQRITDYNKANDNIRANFVKMIADADAHFNSQQTAILNLRRTNPDVEKYLAAPIPPALLCVLDSSLCAKGSAAPAAN